MANSAWLTAVTSLGKRPLVLSLLVPWLRSPGPSLVLIVCWAAAKISSSLSGSHV